MAAARLCAQAWLSPHIIHINRGQRLIENYSKCQGEGARGVIFFLIYFTFQAISRHFEFFLTKIDEHFWGTSCYVIANLGRLVAAKMRLDINCIEFAYSRPIVYPRPCLVSIKMMNDFGRTKCMVSHTTGNFYIFNFLAH